MKLFISFLIFISFIIVCFIESKFIDHSSKESILLTEWDILAPFPSAPREDVDVLEAYGGINKIPIGDDSTYPSDLVNGGKVGWFKIITNETNLIVNVDFSSNSSLNNYVNWNLIEAWAGSSGAYFSGWAISLFELDESENIILTCSGVAKYWIDDNVFQGDSYGLGLQYNSIRLSSGKHILKVRIIGSEGISFQCTINQIKENPNPIFIVYENTIVPDIVNNEFASPFISITVLNLMNETIKKLSIQTTSEEIQVLLLETPVINSVGGSSIIGAGQITPVNFMIKTNNGSGFVDCPAGTTYSFDVMVTTEFSNHDSGLITLNFSCKAFGDAYTFTFQDYDLSIQYADAIPPNVKGGCDYTNGVGCPVLFALHGAGVDAKSGAWTGAFQSQNYSWILLPTNRANYGFDWEGGGIKNGFMALQYLCDSLPGVPSDYKNQYICDQYQLQYLGHSMGGHGAEHVATTICPDRAISLSVAAGWIDMKIYSPNFLRVGYSWSHPRIRYILDSVVSENDSDLHSTHLINIPLIVRCGSDDDNVPPFHLRRMLRLYDQLHHNTSAGLISEIPGEGHWFNGVVDDPIMQSFLDEYILKGIPKLPDTFLINCLNPGSFQGKGGISIQQAVQNFKISKIKVDKTNSQSTGIWNLKTENVKRFGFNQFIESPKKVMIDGKQFNYVRLPSHYCNSGSGNKKTWSICNNNDWQWSERSPLNSGPIVQIIEFPLLIVYGTIGSEEESIQRENLGIYLSNVLMYQMRYSISVISDVEFTNDLFSTYNVIFMGGPETNKAVYNIQSNLPVQFPGNGTFSIDDIEFSGSSIGILFLSSCYSGSEILKMTPKQLSNRRQGCMVTVIEGTDSIGFENAVFQFPTKSSFPMPDYMILGPNFGYQGVSGAYALGFWDNNWNYQDSLSYITSILND